MPEGRVQVTCRIQPILAPCQGIRSSDHDKSTQASLKAFRIVPVVCHLSWPVRAHRPRTNCGLSPARRGRGKDRSLFAHLGRAQTAFFPPPSPGASSCSATGANWMTCTISGSTLTLGAATGQTSHLVIGTCGSATSFAPCSLVAGDLPSIPLSTGVTGTLPAANLPAPAGGGPPGGLAALTSSTGGLGNGETTVVSYLIPGGTIQAGTTYRIRAFGTCSSTVASNTSHFYIRYGSADSSSDTALYSPTLTSTTGASAIPFAVDMIVTFQSTTVSQAQYAYWQ